MKNKLPLNLLEVGWDKNGDMDFGVNCLVTELSHADMKTLREMIIVAIGTMEDMWRRENEKRQQADQVNSKIS